MTEKRDLNGQVCSGPGTASELDGFALRLAEWNSMSQGARGALCTTNGPKAGRSPAADLASEWINKASSRSKELARSIRAQERELARRREELGEARRQERRAVIAAIVELMQRLGITVEELQRQMSGPFAERPERPAAASGTSPVQVLGPQGQVWLGQGRRPNWLKQFLAAGGQLSDLQQPKARDPETV